MKFGSVPIEAALGAINVHAIKQQSITLKKGAFITEAHIELLKQAGLTQITVLRLKADDVGENEAATILAEKFSGEHVRVEKAFTGRVNFYAEKTGLLILDEANILRANSIDEAITLATLPNYRFVSAGEMIATVKIIPFAVIRASLNIAISVNSIINVAPFLPSRIGVVSTLLPGLKSSTVDKTLAVTGKRLHLMAAHISTEIRVSHQTAELAIALKQMALDHQLIIIFGASAISDRRDCLPAAIEVAGGQIIHFGMPVDPGNLLLLGRLGTCDVLGAPGCARSSAENGFDWMLQRLIARIPVLPADIRALGVGGLLKEIATRPQSRLGEKSD